MKRLIDITGQKFGRLTVIEQAPNQGNTNGGSWWWCECDCGERTAARSYDLRTGHHKSCGCLQRERLSAATKRHGRAGSVGYRMWKGAKQRAKERNIPFNLLPTDIPELPKTCPVLGIHITNGQGTRGRCDSSASLDRIKPEKGYTPDNIRIISWRANLLKNNASPDELALSLADARRIEGAA